MICKKQFVKKLRELKFSFKSRTKSERQELYMRGIIAIYVPRQDEILPNLVYVELRKLGISENEIKVFLDDPNNWPKREQSPG
jgi:hypothetical protein